MSNLFEQIGLDMGYIVVGLVAVCIILIVLVIVLLAKQSKANRKYSQFMSGADGKSLEESFVQKFEELTVLRSDMEEAKLHLGKIDETLLTTYQKIGIVKYDAFKEMGGKLSFALALLTDTNDGFIINSMHSSREGCYTYIKEIIKGESFVILAEEEKEALTAAVNSRNYMPR